MRHTELLTNAEYIPRVRELEAQGAQYWTVKVLNHRSGYEITYAKKEAQDSAPVQSAFPFGADTPHQPISSSPPDQP